jgi:hypothetical protein
VPTSKNESRLTDFLEVSVFVSSTDPSAVLPWYVCAILYKNDRPEFFVLFVFVTFVFNLKSQIVTRGIVKRKIDLYIIVIKWRSGMVTREFLAHSHTPLPSSFPFFL